MNLWGGRFTKPTNQLVYDFNASIDFDQTFYQQDIQGSIAHVKMLTKQNILTLEEGLHFISSCYNKRAIALFIFCYLISLL